MTLQLGRTRRSRRRLRAAQVARPLTRRELLALARRSPAAAAGVGAAWPATLPRMAFAPAHRAPRGDVLVVVFLRGAADALNVFVPHGDEDYHRLRPTLAIARPDDPRAPRDDRARDLDGFFGLHPALAPLLPAWQDRRLAIVHACGAPDESRSHFQAMALMERGVSDETGPASGWIGRHLGSLDTGNASPLRAIGLGPNVQHSLRGPVPAAAIRSIADAHLGRGRIATALRQSLDGLYDGPSVLDQAGRDTLAVIDRVAQLDPAAEPGPSDPAYPEGDFGTALRQVALLVRAEVGLEVAAVDLGGWDTHFGQGATAGPMAARLSELGRGLAALHADLRDHMERLCVVVMSEFGRRASENASLGTDHGHGGAMLLLGGGVHGGRVHGAWPGLHAEALVGPGDLAVTTDYRDVLGAVVRRRLNNPSLEAVFPGHAVREAGVVRARR